MLSTNLRTAARFVAVLSLCFLADPRVFAADADAASLARETLAETGVRGGVIVHVGCGDGRLTAALGAGEGCLVQGLDIDRTSVDKAREHLRSLGGYGKVTADTWDGRRLPYIDNFVNLLVAEEPGDLPMNEVLRVLCPGGTAYLKQDGRWSKTVKPRPAEIDEWTHFLHGPDNNAVAHDTVVGPPRHLQWVGGPRYSRHHDRMSSVSAAVSAGGRVFYIMDLAPDVSILMAPEWNLIARDAFNGTVLWRRPIGPWFSHMHGLKSGPADLPRRLVAVGDRVYVTLGIGKPVTALDAATGETVRTYDQTENAEELLCSEGVLFVQTGGAAKDRKSRQSAPPDKTLVAARADSGEVLWTAEQPILRGTLAADPQRVAFMAGDRVVSLDRRDGREQWQSEPLKRAEKYPVRSTPTLVLHDDVVLFSGGEFAAEGNRSWAIDKYDTLSALSAATGAVLWTAPQPMSGYASAEDLPVIDGVVWCGETTSGHAVGRFTGRDVHTGKIVAQFDPDVQTYWFHHRCHRGKATDNYVLTSRTGVEFVDVHKQHWTINDWFRGACLYGIMPANGLVYAPENPCACFLEARLTGFNALAPARDGERDVQADSTPRLERGPAFSQIQNPPSTIQNASDWPTYRHDPARSGRTTTAVPAELAPAWTAELGGRLTSPVIAAGRVLVASIDTHTLHALDADSGEPLWQYTAGGRVDSPPTVWQGRVLFGSADGWVYCLRAADGELAWRFRAAPADRRHMAYEQIESVWPVHGSVLVEDGLLWLACGRSAFLDGGIRLYRLDPRTGEVLSETLIDDRDPAAGKMLQDYVRQLNMPVALPDVLSTDGRLVYMRSQPFERDGTRLPLEALPYAGNPERYSVPGTQNPEHAHLFSPTGFLDDTWWHRTYWIYGSRFLGGWAGYARAGNVTPGGKILVFDDARVYGFGRKPQYYRWTTPIEHQLFAAAKDASAVPKGAEGVKTAGVFRYWTEEIPLLARAMVLAGDTLFFAGPADLVDEEQAVKRLSDPAVQKQLRRQEEAFRGDRGGSLWAVSAEDGTKLSELPLDTIPVFDGMAAAGGSLYLSGVNGRVTCFQKDGP